MMPRVHQQDMVKKGCCRMIRLFSALMIALATIIYPVVQLGTSAHAARVACRMEAQRSARRASLRPIKEDNPADWR